MLRTALSMDPASPPNVLQDGTRSIVGARAMAQATQERATERFERMADKASDQLKHLADRAEDAAGRVAEQSRDAGERMHEVAGNFKGAVDKSVKEQPMATLALAAIAGFVLGALWKR
jgi:ElaB/YqjD/DUF883 family membrane-anchored ribosome-binding protein